MKDKRDIRVAENIRFLEGHPLPYRMQIERDHQIIRESYDSLEEAIAARDEIKSNYLETGQIKHSSIYEWGHLKLAKRKYRSNDLKRLVIASDKSFYSIDTVCKKCGRRKTYRWSGSYQRFIDRGQICKSCFSKDQNRDRINIRNSNNNCNSTNRTTGIKNVSFDKNASKYHVSIRRKMKRLDVYANTLEEAIAIKERILDFYKDHDRLPTRDEV